jgi:hypothetical protein
MSLLLLRVLIAERLFIELRPLLAAERLASARRRVGLNLFLIERRYSSELGCGGKGVAARYRTRL